LGFSVAWQWGQPTSRVGITLDSAEIQARGSGVGRASWSVRRVLPDDGVNGYYEECRARGADIFLELGDRPFGMRDFRVEDPSGNRVGFGEALAR